ncbi:MAG: hypothetical protein ACRD3Y_04465, partial [Bryobacteraceae bacterium]
MNGDPGQDRRSGGQIARWRFSQSSMARLRRAMVTAGRVAGVRYWFPHIPLATALAAIGCLLLWIIFSSERAVLLSDFPKH